MTETKLQVVQSGLPLRNEAEQEERELTLAEKLKRKAEVFDRTVDPYPYEQVAKEMVVMAVAWIEGEHVERTAGFYAHRTPTGQKLSRDTERGRDNVTMKPWLDAAAKAAGLHGPGVEVNILIKIDLDKVTR